MTMHLLTDILQESILDLRNSQLRPVKVAVIDSGIDSKHEILCHKVIGAREYVEKKVADNKTTVIEKPLSYQKPKKEFEHGTAVASIISRIAPNARFLDYKIFGTNGSYPINPMLAGLKAAIDGDAKIINMSEVCNYTYRYQIEDLCELAYQKHKIIIAAKRNPTSSEVEDLGFPAELATCISVDNIDYGNNPFLIEHIDQQPIEFAAHGENVLVAKSGGGYQRVSGTSMATPTVTGFVALLLGRYPDLELFEIKSILKYHSQKGTFHNPCIINPLEVSIPIKKKDSPTTAGFMCPKCRQITHGDDAFSYIKCPACGYVFPLFSDMDKKLFQKVITVLSDNKELVKCPYHNAQHTREVVSNTHAFIQRHCGLSASERKCLMAAALLHDYGYVESYTDNEPIAAQYAGELLPSYGFNQQEIELVKSLILATTMPVNPKTQLEKILCDADVGHIGQDLYWEKTKLLRNEREMHGNKLTESEWLESEIRFLSNHHFYQKWLEAERKEKRKQAVEKLSDKLNSRKRKQS